MMKRKLGNMDMQQHETTKGIPVATGKTSKPSSIRNTLH